MKRSWFLLFACRAPILRSSQDQRGMILPLTLMILLILTSVILALVAMGGTEAQITASFLRTTQALDLAEAGAERAIAQFIANPAPVNTACDPACPNPVVPVSLFGGAQSLGNLGTYTVTYRPIAFATVLIQSTGRTQIGGTQQIVQVIVTTQFNSIYALLSGQVEAPGFVRGKLGAIHGNKQTQIAQTSYIEQTATSSGQCELCTDPTLVGNPAGSGPNQPLVSIPSLSAYSLLPKADYVLGDGVTVVNGILVPEHQILIVATSTLVPENTGPFIGWSGSQFTGSTTPLNGTYYSSKEIHIQASPGTVTNPWKATLISGTNKEEGRVHIEGNVNIVPALEDLLIVAGEVEVHAVGGGNANLAGVIASSRTLPPTQTVGQVEIHPGVTLNGNVIAGSQIELHAGATINYNVATRTGTLGQLKVLSWSPR